MLQLELPHFEVVPFSWDEGWTQEKIAKVKGVSQQLVSKRITMHKAPQKIKDVTTQGTLTETHIREIIDNTTQVVMSPWLTTEQAWEAIAEKVGVTVQTINNWISIFRNLADFGNPPESRQHFDVWNNSIQ